MVSDVKTPPGLVHAFEWIHTPSIRISYDVLKKNFNELVNYKGFNETHDNLKSSFVVVVGTMPSHTII